MLAAIADDENQRPAIRVALAKDHAESAGLLGMTEEGAGFEMRGEPFGHQRPRYPSRPDSAM